MVNVTSRPFLKALKGIQDGSDYVSGLVISYDASRGEAHALRRQLVEQMQFTAHRRELYAENQRLRRMINFVRREPRLILEPVDVIANFRGVLKIDRGSTHGIESSMCVLTEDGIVGLITEVDWTTATVVTLHNAGCKIGAMIRRNRVRGIVHGSGSDLSDICTIEYIDMKDAVRKGDEVVTSPESLFPSGRLIGLVVAVHDTGTLWKHADVAPAVDPYRVDEVFIIRRATSLLDELAGPEEPGDGVLFTPRTMPDNRPLQERYAP